ncbi:MAG: hypothetical protein AAGC57_16960 [Pseudomonadota bacterium]
MSAREPNLFFVSRGRAWGQVVLGWICAQSLLTLLPIAPPGWGTPFLLVTGGGFALWALSGLRLALTRRAMLEIGPSGVRFGLDAPHMPWAAIERWAVDAEQGRIVLRLADRRPRRWWLRNAPGTLDMRPLDARLTEVAQAFRDERPDLEASV